jgi:hypothetical protein
MRLPRGSVAALEQTYDVVAAEASATAASLVRRRKVKLSCR